MAKLCQFLLYLLLLDLCSGGDCPGKCAHGKCLSCLCFKKFTETDCTHQLVYPSSGSCLFRNRDADKEDIVLKPQTELYPIGRRPFLLQAHYDEELLYDVGFKLSFNSFPSTDMKYSFRIRLKREPAQDYAREFILRNVSSSPNGDSVFWDCPLFNHFIDKDFELTVLDSEGRGGEYLFRAPKRDYINPNKTPEWRVFLIFDVGHFVRHRKAAITLQRAPFANLTYKIDLRRCQVEDFCDVLDTIKSNQFREEEKTFQFDLNEVGMHKFTVQILNRNCSSYGGCRLSQSPSFEVTADYTMWAVLLGIKAIFIFTLLFVLLYYFKKKNNLLLKLALSRNPTSLLIVYLPENKNQFNFVKILAAFLRDTCFVNPLLVDTNTSQKNPNVWTADCMTKADRVVFLVPSNPQGKSVTPVQKHWACSLSFFSGQHFMRHSIHKCATLIIPSISASVPAEIANLRRFCLMRDISSLVTWIHNGPQVDQWLLWRSQITSASDGTTLTHLREGFEHLLSGNQVPDVPEDKRTSHGHCSNKMGQSQHPPDSVSQEIIFTKKPGCEFDIMIPDIDLIEKDEDSKEDSHSDDDDSDELFAKDY